MLGQRIVTAVVLLALLLPALFASQPWAFAALTLLLIAAAGWEWGRLNDAGGPGSLAMGVCLAAACAVAWTFKWTAAASAAIWWFTAAVWIIGGALALRAGPSLWQRVPQPQRWIFGLVALWAAWLAVVQARAIGLNFILSVFCLVWVADIAAYAGGRAFGRRKLAPTISPGKSWEGAFSGLLGVWVLGLFWMLVIDHRVPIDSDSLYSHLCSRFGWAGFFVLTAGLSAMSVVGDLMESLVKRAAGAKDSSGLLPGHGGVLDRLDALLPVFPIALALGSLV